MTVVNKRTHTPTANDVYIGRGSIWGNLYIIGTHGNREEVIEQYKDKMQERLNGTQAELWLDRVLRLEGKTLVCYCKPQACHGDVLSELVEELMT